MHCHPIYKSIDCTAQSIIERAEHMHKAYSINTTCNWPYHQRLPSTNGNSSAVFSLFLSAVFSLFLLAIFSLFSSAVFSLFCQPSSHCFVGRLLAVFVSPVFKAPCYFVSSLLSLSVGNLTVCFNLQFSLCFCQPSFCRPLFSLF